MGCCVLHAPPRGIDGGNGENEGGDDQAADRGGPPRREQEAGLALGGKRAKPLFAPCGASGEQHGIGRREVVVAAASGHELDEREEVHPADHAPALAVGPGKEKPEAGQAERHRNRVEDLPELVQEEVVRAAHADVAGVDAAHPGKAQEVVLVLPPEIGRDDDERQSDAAPEPGAAKVAAVRGQQHRAQEGDGKERHGVLGHESEADEGTDGEPPAGVTALKQERDAPGHGDPPEQIEGHVGHERAGEEDGASDAGRKCRDERGLAAAADGARHQPGENGREPTGGGGEEAEADERGTEEHELDAGEERGDGRVDDVSPLEVAGVGVGEELVAVETVARACDEMQGGEG